MSGDAPGTNHARSQSPDDGFPTLPLAQGATTLSTVSASPAAPSLLTIQNGAIRTSVVATFATFAVVGCAFIHLPVMLTEPLYSAINCAVTATMIALGVYLILTEREKFTGFAFAFAGFMYPINDLDIYPHWGAYISYVFGGGALFYGSISWGILRYGRRSLETTAEKIFLPTCLILTSGSGALATTFARPEWLGFPADSMWPTLWPDYNATIVASILICIGFLFTAFYFCILLWKRVRSTPAVSRGELKPLAIFGSGLAVGSAIIFTVSTLAPNLFPFHTLLDLIGILTLGVAGAFGAAIVRHRLLAANLIEDLPDIKTADSVNDYIRSFLKDPTAELLYWSTESNTIIDSQGRRRTTSLEFDPSRLWNWIEGSDGTRLALLCCDPSVSKDPSALSSLGRVITLIAENARLNALLHMRVIQLTAARTAEQLASLRAREEFRRNLHDGLQQTISSIRLDVDGIAESNIDDSGRLPLQSIETKLDKALEQIRGLKNGSRPPELLFGLKAAAERSIAELRLSAVVNIPEGNLGILTLPVYYLIRESLTNIHKYASSQHVAVSVVTDGETVDVIVRDDGVGGAHIRPGGGLEGVRQRVEELGGTFRFNSPMGRGTTLKATIPCVS